MIIDLTGNKPTMVDMPNQTKPKTFKIILLLTELHNYCVANSFFKSTV